MLTGTASHQEPMRGHQVGHRKVKPEEMEAHMYVSQADQIEQLLGAAIAALDIPDADFAAAEARYQSLGDFLRDYWADDRTDGAVYLQGSGRLGTVTGLIHRNDEYDLDLVCRRDLLRESITQAELKADVGHGLELFVKSEPEGSPELDEEGKRCWTLLYPGHSFHLDVLPGLPNPEAKPNGILLTDTELHPWQKSNPVDYATWFHEVMKTEWLQKARRFAESNRMSVEDVPRWRVKTTLQRTVQALKRHRDIYFTDDLHNRTASVIITTLAARAYRPGGTLYEVLADVTKKLPELVQRDNGVYVVSNPVQPEENFADRWQKHPERAERFFQWIEHAQAHFAAIGAQRGLDRILEVTSSAFGSRPAQRAEEALGVGLHESRRAGRLSMLPGTATLVSGTTRPVRPHAFHGDSPNISRA